MGHIPVDVGSDNIDMLSLSAHKFHGPKGTGALYVRRGIRLESLIHGGGQERGKRAGTENVPAVMGMAAALEEACETMEESGIVNFSFEGIEGETLLLLLDEKGICASSGSACASGSLDPSHVLLAMGRPHEIAAGSLRLSLSEENTDEEVEYIIGAVREAVEYLRSISPVWRDLREGRRAHLLK